MCSRLRYLVNQAVLALTFFMHSASARYVSNNGKDLVLQLASADTVNNVTECHNTCANGTRAYITEITTGGTPSKYSIVHSTDERGLPKTDMDGYAECMTECLGFGDDKYAIQLDADIFYASARDYDEIKHILDTIGSDLGPGYEYIGSDGEDSYQNSSRISLHPHVPTGGPEVGVWSGTAFSKYVQVTFSNYV